MPEPESIRDICRGLVSQHRRQQESFAQQNTTEAIVNEMASIVNALENLPPVEGATYERDPYSLTGIDKMLLERMGINPWE